MWLIVTIVSHLHKVVNYGYKIFGRVWSWLSTTSCCPKQCFFLPVLFTKVYSEGHSMYSSVFVALDMSCEYQSLQALSPHYVSQKFHVFFFFFYSEYKCRFCFHFPKSFNTFHSWKFSKFFDWEEVLNITGELMLNGSTRLFPLIGFSDC